MFEMAGRGLTAPSAAGPPPFRLASAIFCRLTFLPSLTALLTTEPMARRFVPVGGPLRLFPGACDIDAAPFAGVAAEVPCMAANPAAATAREVGSVPMAMFPAFPPPRARAAVACADVEAGSAAAPVVAPRAAVPSTTAVERP